MANTLQFRRGSGVPGSIFREGEPIFDLSGKTLYVGVGTTALGPGVAVASSETYLASVEFLTRAISGTSGRINLYEATSNGSNYVSIAASATLGSSYTLTLPNSDGEEGQVLKTDGSGNLSWVTPTSGFGGFSISDGTISQSIADGNTITFVSGEGIDAVVSATDTVTISAESASATNAGIASFRSTDFYFENTYNVGVVTATATTKGIASFDADYFVVSNGAVTVKTGGSSGIVTSVIGTANEIEVTSNSGTYQIGLPDNVSIANNLTVNGNLVVVGTAVTFETQVVQVEDRLIELGLVGGATTSFSSWDLGVAFNYGDGSNAKKSGVFWLDNQFVGIASAISISNDTGIGTSDPQVTIDSYAPVASGGLYIGGITSNELVINNSREAVNLIFDGGGY